MWSHTQHNKKDYLPQDVVPITYMWVGRVNYDLQILYLSCNCAFSLAEEKCKTLESFVEQF